MYLGPLSPAQARESAWPWPVLLEPLLQKTLALLRPRQGVLTLSEVSEDRNRHGSVCLALQAAPAPAPKLSKSQKRKLKKESKARKDEAAAVSEPGHGQASEPVRASEPSQASKPLQASKTASSSVAASGAQPKIRPKPKVNNPGKNQRQWLKRKRLAEKVGFGKHAM